MLGVVREISYGFFKSLNPYCCPNVCVSRDTHAGVVEENVKSMDFAKSLLEKHGWQAGTQYHIVF